MTKSMTHLRKYAASAGQRLRPRSLKFNGAVALSALAIWLFDRAHGVLGDEGFYGQLRVAEEYGVRQALAEVQR